MTAPVLCVKEVQVTFGGVAALQDVSLHVDAGEVVAVIGPNGAGKSTLFNALTGLAPPRRGRIELSGKPLQRTFGGRHGLVGLFFASLVAITAVALEVGPEAAFEEVVVRPYEVAYVAAHTGGTQASGSVVLPGVGQRLWQMLEGAPSVGASWRGYQVWLPNHRPHGPLWPSYSAAQEHAQALTDETRAHVQKRLRHHFIAGAVGFVFGAITFAQLFFRSRRSPDHIARMGVARTFQNIRLFAGLSALDNVRVALGGSGDSGRRAHALLKQVGLATKAHMRASALAYGDMRRLEIARALATSPKLLLLDEPAAGMNAVETQALQHLIVSIAQGGTAVLLIEHDMPLVMDVAHRIVVLEYGQKIADGTPQQVRADPRVIGAYLGHEDAATTRPNEKGEAHA